MGGRAARRGGRAHFGELRGGTTGDLRDAELAQLGLQLLELLLQLGLGLGADLMSLDLRLWSNARADTRQTRVSPRPQA